MPYGNVDKYAKIKYFFDAPTTNPLASGATIVGIEITLDIMTLWMLASHRPNNSSSTIVVFPGCGEHERVAAAVAAQEAWNQTHSTPAILLLAGDNPDHLTARIVHTPEDLKTKFDLTVQNPETVVSQGIARNTKEQAIWAAGQLRGNSTDVDLFASTYHMPRAYMTLLKQIMTWPHQEWPRLWPNTTGLGAPFTQVPVSGYHKRHAVFEEITRIEAYRAKGDVISTWELSLYLAWLAKT